MSSRVIASARFRVSFSMLLFLGDHFVLVLSTLFSFPQALPFYKNSQTNFQEQRICTLYAKKNRSSPLHLAVMGKVLEVTKEVSGAHPFGN